MAQFRHVDQRRLRRLAGARQLRRSNSSGAAVSLSVGGDNASTTFSGSLRRQRPDEDRLRHVHSDGPEHLQRKYHATGGTLQLLGGQLPPATEYVGYGGAASLIQSGGSNAVTSTLNVGYNSSIAKWQRPALHARRVRRRRQLRRFRSRAGPHAVSSNLYVGYSNGSGTYALNGNGLLSAALRVYRPHLLWILLLLQFLLPLWLLGVLRGSGHRQLTQTGGTHAVAGSLYLGRGNGRQERNV